MKASRTFTRTYKRDAQGPTAIADPDQALAPWLQGRAFAEWREEFDREGYLVFEKVLPAEEIERVRSALQPYLTKTGRNDFEGFQSNRVYALLAKAPEVFSDMVTHPLALSFVEADLGPTCLLSALLAINLHPGETVQPWHYDDGNIHLPLPRPSCGVSAFWSIDETTETNGATEIIPRSHLWEKGEVKGIDFADLFDQRERDPGEDPAPHPDAIKATMPAGSLMLTKGTLWHRGGANLSKGPRMIITPQYCPGWARQLENMLLAVPRETTARLPQRTRELIGYSIHGSFMGYVDGLHPEKSLPQP